MKRIYRTYNKIINPELYENYFHVEDCSGVNNEVILQKLSNVSNSDIDKSPDINFEYSYDGIQWNSLSPITSQVTYLTLPANSKLYLRGNNKRLGIDMYDTNNKQYICYINITCRNEHNICGNIMSLLYGAKYLDKITFPSNSSLMLYGLFQDSKTLINANTLTLPATTLTNYCYQYMFYNCSNLRTSPQILPALIATNSCYYSMFQNCTKLMTSPELLATTLANNCYYGMFSGCSNLTTTVSLPATKLAKHCYQNMYSNCINLTSTQSSLPATELIDYCYSHMFNGCTKLTRAMSVLPATTLAHSCYTNMFSNCTNLKTCPELPATIMVNNCYTNMFSNCKSITATPNLPGIILADNCYQSMFSSCINLTQVATILPATTLAPKCYYNMFNSCKSLQIGPELPALYLEKNCYQYMFQGCTSLNYIKAYFIEYSNASDEMTNWMYNVAKDGTFVINPDTKFNPDDIRGTSGIPSNWTVIRTT